MRGALVEAAWMMLRYNPWARAVYDRLCSRQKTRKKKAIVAVARKLLVRCWVMLLRKETWNKEAGMATLTIRAFWPLRIRVNMSAIGSVIPMFVSPLPARLRQPGNLAFHGGFTELVTAQAEFAIDAVGPAGNRTTITLA